MQQVKLVGIPIDSKDRFIIDMKEELSNSNILITSPTCGLDKIGFACACCSEKGIKPIVYGFSHSAGQQVNSVTIASIWLAFSAALLIAKIRLKAENDFISYGCFYQDSCIDINKFLENTSAPDDLKDDVLRKFNIKDYTPISALEECAIEDIFSVKTWLSSWAFLSTSNWRFPLQSFRIAATLDARYLSGCGEYVSSDIPQIDRTHWRLRAFDPVVAALSGHCISASMSSMPIYASKNSIVSLKKDFHNGVPELWQEMIDLAKSLVSERVKWDSSKSAVRNWYAAKLRKYNNATKE